jgi:Mce-associated membrane protein
MMRRALAGAVLAGALALCGAGAWSYAQARGDDDLAYGRARDAALADGRAAVATLTTLDASTAAHARAGVTTWKTVTSGPLRTRLGSLAPASGASSRGVVTDAALTALDDRAGTAKLIATVRVETTPKNATSASTDRKRLEAVLARAADGTWKVKTLDAVPVTEVTG